jgi:hypothetical protein
MNYFGQGWGGWYTEMKGRKSIKLKAKLTWLRKDFSIWLKIQSSKFSFHPWLECVEGNDKASLKHLGEETPSSYGAAIQQSVVFFLLWDV